MHELLKYIGVYKYILLLLYYDDDDGDCGVGLIFVWLFFYFI